MVTVAVFSLFFFFESIRSHTDNRKQEKKQLEKTRSEHFHLIYFSLLFYSLNRRCFSTRPRLDTRVA